jgi:DNA-3-methyladenine glycosylase I
MIDARHRCRWAATCPLLAAYHDQEWGRPERDGRALWEKLVLDGFQAGLSWRTVLAKRPAFRRAFCAFEPAKIARFDERRIERLLEDAGIIRSRAKIVAAVGNARAYLRMQRAGEPFAEFVWQFVGGQPLVGDGVVLPTQTPLSKELGRALKARGFSFVGPTIVYAWMQAVGLVDDHERNCFLWRGQRP